MLAEENEATRPNTRRLSILIRIVLPNGVEPFR